VSPIGLVGSWERAESVVIGDVGNITSLGSQKVDNPPWPVASTVQQIYWCQADFRSDSVLKGKAPASGKRFIWAAIRPGCGFEWFRYGYEETTPPATRVWFLREEGEYIRPVVDGGGVLFASFHAKFASAGRAEDRMRFALLFLSPPALGMNDAQYSVIFHTPVDFARVILGDAELADALRRLGWYPDPHLRESTCEYLKINLQQSCK